MPIDAQSAQGVTAPLGDGVEVLRGPSIVATPFQALPCYRPLLRQWLLRNDEVLTVNVRPANTLLQIVAVDAANVPVYAPSVIHPRHTGPEYVPPLIKVHVGFGGNAELDGTRLWLEIGLPDLESLLLNAFADGDVHEGRKQLCMVKQMSVTKWLQLRAVLGLACLIFARLVGPVSDFDILDTIQVGIGDSMEAFVTWVVVYLTPSLPAYGITRHCGLPIVGYGVRGVLRQQQSRQYRRRITQN